MYAIVGTWKMSYTGVQQAFELLRQGGSAGEAIAHAIMSVEDNPSYVSVGYGGLPGRDGQVTLDAAYMDGQTLRFGGVIHAQSIQNPIKAAMLLSQRRKNCLLAGKGAQDFAMAAGLAIRDMLTENAKKRWLEAVSAKMKELEAYRGHDTVCVIAMDETGKMCVGTSTSGLFMKEPGRVGDTPIIGSGFYCDARYGGAAATGLGEDIMRGCLSYDAVSLMRQGALPQEACDEALHRLHGRMLEQNEKDGGISLIAMDPSGRVGASTTLDVFPFAVGRQAEGTGLYVAGYGEIVSAVHRASEDEIKSMTSD